MPSSALQAAGRRAARFILIGAANRAREGVMATVRLIDESTASAEVRAVFDDIRKARNTDWINNFWRALANHPPTLRRIWQGLKEVMAPGALDPRTKELIYLAVSISNGCVYCTASHGAAAKRLGMTEAMLGELIAVVGMANQTNRLADGYRVPVDERFENLF
jgi:AhpD family alkylhydroperoxidase